MIKPLTIPPKKLAQSILSTDMSFISNNIRGWDGNDLATADFGSTCYVVFKNSTNTAIEIMEIDVTTIANPSITILQRGLAYDGSLVSVTDNKLEWSANDTSIMFGTDAPQLWEALKDYIDAVAIAGAPNATVVLQGLLQLATQAQVDAGTATGSTTAPLAVTPDKLRARLINSYVADTGSANAYAIAPSPAITAYAAGQQFSFKALATNTTASTLNVNALGAKAIKKQGTVSLIAGDILAGQVVLVEYDGVNFQILSQTGPLATSDAGSDQSQTTQNAALIFGATDSSGNRNKVAQSFFPATNQISGVTLYKAADTGTFTGNVNIQIQSDSAGSPSGSTLATFTIPNANWLLLSASAEFTVIFSTEYTSLVQGTTYWIVVSASTSDSTNHPNIGINTAGGYASGSAKYNNTAEGWVAISGQDIYFKTLVGIDSKIPISSATNGTLPTRMVKASRLFGYNKTQVTATGSDTVAHTYAIPAGELLASSGIRVIFSTSCNAGGSAATATFKVKINGTTVSSLGAGAQIGGGSNGKAVVDIIIDGDLQHVIAFGSIVATFSTAASAVPTSCDYQAVNVDFSGVCLIQISLSGATVNANETLNASAVEILR